YFLSDGANYQRPGFKSFQCVADGLEFWNNKGGVQVGPTPPSANVTVVRGPSSNQFSGSSITNGIVTTGGTITLPENISSQGDFNCDRIKKLAATRWGISWALTTCLSHTTAS